MTIKADGATFYLAKTSITSGSIVLFLVGATTREERVLLAPLLLIERTNVTSVTLLDLQTETIWMSSDFIPDNGGPVAMWSSNKQQFFFVKNVGPVI